MRIVESTLALRHPDSDPIAERWVGGRRRIYCSLRVEPVRSRWPVPAVTVSHPLPSRAPHAAWDILSLLSEDSGTGGRGRGGLNRGSRCLTTVTCCHRSTVSTQSTLERTSPSASP